MYYDFQAIKRACSVEQAMIFLNLKHMKPEDGAYRGECPACRSGSRSLVITPEKDVYFCHNAKKGGDVISLVAHVHGTSMKDAAGWLEDKLSRKATVPHKQEEGTKHEGFQPLSHLAHEHEAVQDMGFPVDVAVAVGIGFASRGLMRSHVAIPLRTEQGTLVGYIGLPPDTEAKVPDQWWGIERDKVVQMPRRKRA